MMGFAFNQKRGLFFAVTCSRVRAPYFSVRFCDCTLLHTDNIQ